jgi:hypothetical protein
MNAPRIKRTLFLIAFGSMFALGCELIVDFDRTKSPVADAGAVDAAPQDSSVPDAEADAPADAPSDAPQASDASDAGEDADAADAADGD